MAKRHRKPHVGAKMSAEYQRRYRARNPERARANELAYRKAHRADYARWTKEWRDKNPDKVKAMQERRRLKKYGISHDEHARLNAVQDGRCAICRRSETKGRGKYKQLAVDHCHATNKIRGLLCCNCNAILGHASDSTDVLRAAIAYLERPWC